MSVLSTDRIAELLAEYYPSPAAELLEDLSVYLELLLKWNERTNLTSIRHPEQIVRRHFGESLFAAAHLPNGGSLLDLGSGAGFPGIPIQLVYPKLRVTLAESQNKKVAFLREVIRTLALETEVWAGRIEQMSPARTFNLVSLRAVDNPELALRLARARLSAGGTILQLATTHKGGSSIFPLPGTSHTSLELLT